MISAKRKELAMVDEDTFLTTLYVEVDDFCKASLPVVVTRCGPAPSLCRSEVVTLGIFGQWARFRNERDFYRYALRHLRRAFPRLPHYSQFNRLLRQQQDAMTAFALQRAQLLESVTWAYEVLDSSGVLTRDAKRRGRGWLPGLATISWSNRVGWYEGFHLLVAISPTGVLTGFGFASAHVHDTSLAETFFALRDNPHPRLLSVGRAMSRPYVADKGFAGRENRARWYNQYHAQVICPSTRRSRHPWPKPLRRWLASIRQIVETVYDKLHHTLRLDRERPHDITGFQGRLAAKVALHNFSIWLNQRFGRPNLAFADLIDW
jgi:hypothetical protein